MTSESPKVVQFIHPGFEYSERKYVGSRSQRTGVMAWKEGNAKHNRKFIWSYGSAVNARSNEKFENVPLTFWGEWEGPSVYWRIDSSGKPLASVIHAPFLPSVSPSTSVQNTDPMVFGDGFIYSNCRQRRYRWLRSLPAGSIILFGRLAVEDRPSFNLDTCLVVSQVQQLSTAPFDPDTYGTDLVDDAALCPLFSEGFRADFGVHTGHTPSDNAVFSFFPAQVAEDELSLFARPDIRPIGALENVVSPGTQAVKVTHGITESDRDAVWDEVVRQVADQGCLLGHAASSPPLLNADEAERVATQPPAPLNTSTQDPFRPTSDQPDARFRAPRA